MRDERTMIDGPPTKPGEYRIETKYGTQFWGFFDGKCFCVTGSLSKSFLAEHIAKHASLDAPAPEWLPAERLGEEHYGKLVTMVLKDGGSCGLTRHGVVRKTALPDGYCTLGVMHAPDLTYRIDNIERFCVHELPPDPPAAPQRDVWEEVAEEVFRESHDVDSKGCEIDNIVAVLKDHFEPLQQENERLKVQLAGCSVAANGGTKDPAKQGDYGWSVAYQDVLDLRRKYDSGVGETPVPEHNEVKAEPEEDEVRDGLSPTGDPLWRKEPSPTPSLPTPRRFRCKGGRHKQLTRHGYQIGDLYVVVDLGGDAQVGSFNTTNFYRSYSDLEFLPEPLLASN